MPPPPPIAIRNARIFDGAKQLSNGTVVIQGAKIRDVGEDCVIPHDAHIIEGRGCTLLPGLIDSHVHVKNRDSLRLSLLFGVCTVLDMNDDFRLIAKLRKELTTEDGKDLADLRAAGTCVTAPGGHGTEFGLPIPTLSRPEDAASFVEDRIAEGSDYIKIGYDDGTAWGPRFPTLDKETLAATIREAHKRGKMAIVHIMGRREAREAIEVGANGLAHLFVDAPDPKFADYALDHKAFVITTLCVIESLCGIPGGRSLLAESDFGAYLPQKDRERLETTFRMINPQLYTKGDIHVAEATVKQLREAGVPILAGTDAAIPMIGTAYGASLHRELELLVGAGLSPSEALASATSIPADHFGLIDRGRIEPGKRADLLLVDGNPIDEIKNTRKIVGIWKLGSQVPRVPL